MAEDGYLLGHDDGELARLEEQARALGPATETILRLAGIAQGMRVLDLGSGAGDVAFAVARMVGPDGSVLGIDQSAIAVARATERAEQQGVRNASFVEADITTAEIDGPFDAVVGRLILLYMPAPALVLKRYASLVRPGGVVAAMEYEMTAAGMLPRNPLSDRVVGWITSGFSRSGLDPMLGARLGEVFGAAGLGPAVVLGLQGYLPPSVPTGPRMAAGIIRTLLPVLQSTGIATADEVAIDSLESRLAADQVASDAMFKPPTLVGAWARVP